MVLQVWSAASTPEQIVSTIAEYHGVCFRMLELLAHLAVSKGADVALQWANVARSKLLCGELSQPAHQQLPLHQAQLCGARAQL